MATLVPTRIASSYHRVEVRRVLKQAHSLIHITCDMWTGPGHHDFQGVVAHFLDAEVKPRKVLLSLVEQQSGHGGEAQADALWDVVQSFGIRDKVAYFTGDNATSNDKLCASFAPKMSNGWDPVERRIRCQGHIINLAVQVFLFGKSGEAIQLSLGRGSRQSGPEAG